MNNEPALRIRSSNDLVLFLKQLQLLGIHVSELEGE